MLLICCFLSKCALGLSVRMFRRGKGLLRLQQPRVEETPETRSSLLAAWWDLNARSRTPFGFNNQADQQVDLDKPNNPLNTDSLSGLILSTTS